MQKDWIEIRASGPRPAKDEAVALLVAAGSPGVVEADEGLPLPFAVSHSAGGIDAPESGRAEASLTGYIPNPSSSALNALRKGLQGIGWAAKSAPYAHSDWSSKWRKGLKPARVSSGERSIVVKPAWRNVKKRKGEAVIEIDPGMAFGTGSHATTKTCLKALLTLVAAGAVRPRSSTLLDVGTGTGVLAIAGVKLGMKKAVGLDIDPDAIAAARANARLNATRVALSMRAVEETRGRYSLVFANILGNELLRLAPALADRTMPGGYLILSGMLKTEQEAVTPAFVALGFERFKKYSSGEWATLVLVKTP
ncbi:MAG: 50S ribosomal protein L11 methyltransferase [Deltaproteobacteria bacterium]|nr:50S ribosomal protein L11 methyltransferase [Deltaproteobacteria bacterium]